jgi:hypothetical protein
MTKVRRIFTYNSDEDERGAKRIFTNYSDEDEDSKDDGGEEDLYL